MQIVFASKHNESEVSGGIQETLVSVLVWSCDIMKTNNNML